MWKDEASRALHERMSGLSDEELLNIVEVEPEAYRTEALDYAKAELVARGIQFQAARQPVDQEADSTGGESPVMRKLVTCKNMAQAGLLEGLLTGSGIACEIRGEYLSMALGELPFTECYPELWVAGDEDFKRAQAVLAQWGSADDQPQASWICQGCGEENEGQFGSCWRCGRAATGSNDQPRA